MSDSYIRSAHYQRHYQSMVLNLCSIYPHFETDNFDRAYNTELASVTSQYPKNDLGFCYYWTERAMWDRFGLSAAYGEFPGRYGGPGFFVEQQIGINPMPPTPQSAQPAPEINPDFFSGYLKGFNNLGTQFAQPTPGKAPGTSETQAIPASPVGQEQIDLIAMLSAPRPGHPPQRLARNLFEGFLKPQASQDLAAEFEPESPLIPQVIEQSSELATGSGNRSLTPSSLLAPQLAFPELSNLGAPPAPLTPLSPLLLPGSSFKDPTTGEVITVKMFERRCFSRGAETAIKHAHAAINSESRMSKPLARAVLDRSLTTTLAGIIEENVHRDSGSV